MLPSSARSAAADVLVGLHVRNAQGSQTNLGNNSNGWRYPGRSSQKRGQTKNQQLQIASQSPHQFFDPQQIHTKGVSNFNDKFSFVPRQHIAATASMQNASWIAHPEKRDFRTFRIHRRLKSTPFFQSGVEPQAEPSSSQKISLLQSRSPNIEIPTPTTGISILSPEEEICAMLSVQDTLNSYNTPAEENKENENEREGHDEEFGIRKRRMGKRSVMDAIPDEEGGKTEGEKRESIAPASNSASTEGKQRRIPENRKVAATTSNHVNGRLCWQRGRQPPAKRPKYEHTNTTAEATEFCHTTWKKHPEAQSSSEKPKGNLQFHQSSRGLNFDVVEYVRDDFSLLDPSPRTPYRPMTLSSSLCVVPPELDVKCHTTFMKQGLSDSSWKCTSPNVLPSR